MAASGSKTSSFLQFFVMFVLLYLVMQMVLRVFFPQQFGPDSQITGVILRVQDPTVKGGHHPVLQLLNKTDQDLTFEDRCPMPPVDVFRIVDNVPEALSTTETSVPCTPLTSVPAGATTTIDLGSWKYSLFGDYGTYKVQLPNQENTAVDFTISEEGPITKLFRTFVTKPLLNLLILIATYVPSHNLGLSIILLTLLIKLILFFPTQHAMEGQRKMQKVQPLLDEIRRKFKDSPEKMNKEIMALWKREGVNPMQSCLPTLIQFPVLIGLFYTIRDGSVLELSRHLIYASFQDIQWAWNPHFLGLNLLEPSRFVFPPLLVVLQFFQMKLAFALAKRKKQKDAVEKKEETSQQAMQQRMMLYGLPLMIGVFAFKFPAAVSLYWAVSTLFAIGQQVVVNRKI